jgi:hypothetical protein
MPSPGVVEFARLLVRQVRDAPIRNCDQRWGQLGLPGAMNLVVPDVVDETVFSLLHAIDTGSLRVKFVTSSGAEIDLTEDGRGELAGWYMGSGGWRTLFSEERVVDDGADTHEMG